MVILAVALLLWPTAPAVRPTGVAAGVRRRPSARVLQRRWLSGALGGMAGVAVTVTASIPLGLAAATVVATVTALIRASALSRQHHQDRAEIVLAVGVLARALRAGAATSAAVRSAGSVVGVAGRAVLGALGDAAVGADRGGVGETPGVAPEVTDRLRTAWQLSVRHGIPLAGLVEDLEADLTAAADAQLQRAALLAGPRLSGYLLAGLPVVGLLLGSAMGADPVHILIGTGIGRLMSLVGAVLACVGVMWTARIAR